MVILHVRMVTVAQILTPVAELIVAGPGQDVRVDNVLERERVAELNPSWSQYCALFPHYLRFSKYMDLTKIKNGTIT